MVNTRNKKKDGRHSRRKLPRIRAGLPSFRKRLNNSMRLADSVALSQSATELDPQYPGGTPLGATPGARARYIWDSITEFIPSPHLLLLSSYLHCTIPAYRGSSLRVVELVPRATPRTARAWYAVPLDPLECHHSVGQSSYTVTHTPTGLSERVSGQKHLSTARSTCEFRLWHRLRSSGLDARLVECGRVEYEERMGRALGDFACAAIEKKPPGHFYPEG